MLVIYLPYGVDVPRWSDPKPLPSDFSYEGREYITDGLYCAQPTRYYTLIGDLMLSFGDKKCQYETAWVWDHQRRTRFSPISTLRPTCNRVTRRCPSRYSFMEVSCSSVVLRDRITTSNCSRPSNLERSEFSSAIGETRSRRVAKVAINARLSVLGFFGRRATDH